MVNACHGCGKEAGDNEPMMRCGNCKSVTYCSKACQVKHWKFHKESCRITQRTKANMGAKDSKRQFRLWRNWPHNAPLESLLASHYGVSQLKDIHDKMVIEICAAFDYNKQTFVPTSLPILVDRTLFQVLHPGHKRLFQALPAEGVAVSLQWNNVSNGEGVNQTILYPLAGLSAAPIQSGSWDEILEKLFSRGTASLQSSIFGSSSWETMQQENLQNQIELITQSPHYPHFIVNALYIKTLQPRHKTHVVMLQVKMGMGLGQIAQLTDYQVLTLEEATQNVQKRVPPEAFGHYERELDLETHPELLAAQKDNPNIIRLSVLFDMKISIIMKPIFFRIPERHAIVSCSTCDTKARQLFDELTKSSFPTVTSPALH